MWEQNNEKYSVRQRDKIIELLEAIVKRLSGIEDELIFLRADLEDAPTPTDPPPDAVSSRDDDDDGE